MQQANEEYNEAANRNLTQGTVFSSLIEFAVPIILANIIQQLYGMVDLSVIGLFGGNTGTVGVASGSEINDISSMMAISFAGGGQILIAQLTGAGDRKGLKETVGTLVSWVLILATAMLFINITFCKPILELLNCPEEAFAQAVSYIRITAFGIPFVGGYNAVCSILRGSGESKWPLAFIATGAGMNIILDIFLTAVLKYGVEGTAIATVFSQFAVFLFSFLFLCHNGKRFGFELDPGFFCIRRKPLVILLKLGIPRLVQSICIQFTLFWCSSNINTYGIVFSATNSIGNKLQNIVTTFTTSLDTAAAAMIGQSLGARNIKRVSRIVWVTLRCTLVAALLGSALALLFPRQLFTIFTHDTEVLDFCRVYMQIMVLTFISAALLASFGCLISGLGYASLNFILGIMDGVVFRVGFSLLFLYEFHFGAVSFFMGNALARFAPAAISFVYFMSGRWKKRKLLV